MACSVVILEYPRIPQSEVWARSYGVLSGALPRDNAQFCESCGEGQYSTHQQVYVHSSHCAEIVYRPPISNCHNFLKI